MKSLNEEPSKQEIMDELKQGITHGDPQRENVLDNSVEALQEKLNAEHGGKLEGEAAWYDAGWRAAAVSTQIMRQFGISDKEIVDQMIAEVDKEGF